MKEINVRDAREKFSELLNAVECGEEVTILRRGKPVARLTQTPTQKPVDFPSHQALRERLPPMSESAANTIRAIRDEEADRF
jgi:prevent-host-death family protein